MYSISSELWMDIFSRLPAKELLLFRCVCKYWCRLIDDPYFTNRIHLDRQISMIHDFSNGVSHLFLLTNDEQFRSLYLDGQLLNFEGFDFNSHMNPNPMWKPKPPNEISSMEIVSCNGLMLISNYRPGFVWSIWNPLTREVHDLPFDLEEEKEVQIRLPGSRSSSRVMYGGFGYDCISDDYKVLKITRVYDCDGKIVGSFTCLYSLQSNSWKQIEDFSSLTGICSTGVFLNGALHYIGLELSFIVSFDLVTEEYRTYKLPFPRKGKKFISLGELGGYLYLSRHIWGECTEWWLMNDYGIENSWTLLFKIAERSEYGSIKSLCYSKSKRLVLLENKKPKKSELFWFDLENKTTKDIEILGSFDVLHSFVSMKSLVRIREGSG